MLVSGLGTFVQVQRAAQVVSLNGETMGTTWSVKLAAREGFLGRSIRDAIEAGLALVIAQMSPWDHESDLSRFNRAAAGSWHTLSDEFFSVLTYALGLARMTHGAYDPTIGALTELWGFGPTGRRSGLPGADDVERDRGRAGWTHLSIDEARHAVMQPGDLQLDLSSIAKGFAVDLVSDVLTRRGFVDHLVEIGGELRCSGTKPDQSPWWVALDSGDGVAGETIVALHGLSVATSGTRNASSQRTAADSPTRSIRARAGPSPTSLRRSRCSTAPACVRMRWPPHCRCWGWRRAPLMLRSAVSPRGL